MDDFAQLLDRCMAVADGMPLPEADAEALRRLMRRRPAVTIAPLLLLRHADPDTAPDELARLRAAVALGCSDRRTLAFARHGADWADFYPEPEEAPAKETTDVIDTFLRTYGSCTPEEERLLEKMIFNPAPDYAEMLAREEQENLPPVDSPDTDPREARINAFIRTRHPAAHPAGLMTEAADEPTTPATEKTPVERPAHTDDSLLSESLAKIFIKQGRYERAYEIISDLNLKFPKKSAYFADQLRFLQKLIINRRHLQGLDGSDAALK